RCTRWTQAADAGERIYKKAGLCDLHRRSRVCRYTAPLRTRQHHVVVGLSAYGGDLSALAGHSRETLRQSAGAAAQQDRARNRRACLRYRLSLSAAGAVCGSCQAWVARSNRDAVGFQSKGTAGTEERTGHAEGRSFSGFSGSLIYCCCRPDTAVAAIGIAVLVSLLSARCQSFARFGSLAQPRFARLFEPDVLGPALPNTAN